MREKLSEYGMVLVLLLLGAAFSVLTIEEQHLTGSSAARQIATELAAPSSVDERVLIAVRDQADDHLFAQELSKQLAEQGWKSVEVVEGQPADLRSRLEALSAGDKPVDVLVVSQSTASWGVVQRLAMLFPTLAKTRVVEPQRGYRWPTFLTSDNLLNIANQVAVIAIIAAGMTMVIITGGIDLSVGSLIALSAVVSALLIRDVFGAVEASPQGMFVACTAGMALCAATGAITGTISLYQIPSFIVTLSMMLIARGAARNLSANQSIYQIPDSFVWLGRGADLFDIPNAVLLMLAIYVAGHVVMSRTTLGRYIYAVGGNAEAARLAGVPVRGVIIMAFAISGALAGLGGVVLASQLKSGDPTYGRMYELYAIAAVVVGGTSLAGGEGHIFGTLIGALVIAVIQNGMNLLGIESATQEVVLGLVLLGAVALDRLRRRST